MRNGAAREVAVDAGARDAAPGEAPLALGWDGIAAILILIVAAAPVRGWMTEPGLVDQLSRALWWLIYVAAALRLVQQSGTEWLRWTTRHQPALCVLLALTVASCLWSLAPLLTLQRAASLLGTTMVGLFIGYSLPPQRLMRVLFWTFTLVMLCSVVVALAFPETILAPGQPVGWRGIMTHKNTFGATAVVATIFFLTLAWWRVQPLWSAGLSALCLLAVVQAHSRTAVVALVFILIAFVLLAIAWRARRPIRGVVRPLSIALVLAVSALPLLIGPIAAVLGNDDPLNGRTHLWDGAVTILHERPLTGYGYAVVWGRGTATLLPNIPVTAHRSASTAHNSIVHVASELGIPAAIVACIYLFGSLVSAGRLFERTPSPFAFFALLFLVGFAVMCFSEAHLLQIHWLFWILFVAVTVAVARALSGGPPAARDEGAA